MNNLKDKVTLKKRVIEEATLLREHATPEELHSLNFNILNAQNRYLCIYGQMTGNCYGKRAASLITKCAVPTGNSSLVHLLEYDETWNDMSAGYRPHTAIEYYITLLDSKSDILIDYLKGKIPILCPRML